MKTHKKRPTRWHRDGYMASCGVVLIKRLPLNERVQTNLYSYVWKEVDCKNCLKFLKVVKIDFLNKHTGSK